MPRPTKNPIPRGIRNNNPLNIRIGNVWLGEVSEPTDPDFEQFVSMKYGLRAAFVLLRRYIRHYKRTDIPSVISAWAPASENNTTHYIDMVVQFAKIDVTQMLRFEDKAQMCALVAAMAKVETGTTIDSRILEDAYDLA